MGDKITLRPVVLWFAEQMELTLQKNDHKGGWSGITYSRLMSRLDDESRELFLALHNMDKLNGDTRVVEEATDVANFAMMIADNQGPRIGLSNPPTLDLSEIVDFTDDLIEDLGCDCERNRDGVVIGHWTNVGGSTAVEDGPCYNCVRKEKWTELRKSIR